MRTTQDILFGIDGQVLLVDCPDGRPSSATSTDVWEYTDGDSATTESATTGSPTVETNPNTTLDATSGDGEANPRLVNLTSTTDIVVGRQYLITGTLGQHEWVEVAKITSGASITAKHPLKNSYASTSTFQSTRVTIPVSSTWVADTVNLSANFNPNPRYRVRWEVIIGGVTYVYETAFDLVRYASLHSVTPVDVTNYNSTWLDWLGPDDRVDQGRQVIHAAFLGIKYDLYGDNRADQSIRNPEAFDELVMRRAVLEGLYRRAAAGLDVNPNSFAAATDLYRQRYDQFIRAPVVQSNATSDGGALIQTPTPLRRR